MKIFPAVALGAALLASSMVFSLTSASAEGGKELFLKNQCNKCHTITSQGIQKLKGDADDSETKPPDLSHVGKEKDAGWIVKWLNREEKIKGKVHRKKLANPGDAQALAAWLAGLK